MEDDAEFQRLARNVLRPGNVRYFAFGSNLNPKVLEEMRGLRPVLQEPAIVTNYRLAFNLRGIPWTEPSFASAEPSDKDTDELHGVVYTLNRPDWNRLALSEGVGTAYDLEEVTCRTYAGDLLSAVTLRTREGLLRSEKDVPPSRAYLNILIEGAYKSGLRQEYIDRLKAVPTSNQVLFDSRGFSRYFRTASDDRKK